MASKVTTDEVEGTDRQHQIPAFQAGDPPAPSGSATELIFRRPNWLPKALIFGDAIIVGVAILGAYWYRFNVNPGRTPIYPPPMADYLLAIPAVVLLYSFALALNRQYSSWRGRALVDQLFTLYSGIALAGMFILAAISIARLGIEYSRLVLAYTLLISAFLMTTERYVLRQYETRLRRRGIGTERVLIVGSGTASQLLIRRMTMFPQYGFHVCGVVDDDLSVGTLVAGARAVGTIGQLPEVIRRLRIDQVFLALPGAPRDELLRLIKLCEDEQVEFKLVPDLLEIMTNRVAADAIDGLPFIGVRRNRLRGSAAILKRTIDIIVSTVGLVVISPIIAAIAVAMKLTSPGPVLFRQERIGLHGEPFTLYKFRSMIVDAEAMTGPVVAQPGDDRCTPLGRLLRRLSLDELPQLYNVLRGDMSLVGPRPMRPFLVERYSEQLPRYLERHQVRPGLSGWAEVNDFRGAAAIADRALYDLYYVENWSLILDLKIIVLTAVRMFFQRHAY